MSMQLSIPNLSLVVLVGPSGSGKSTFARKHFRTTEVISSDFCRGMLGDDENDQAVTKEAFELLHTIASKRLALGRLTVVDATNVQPESRRPLVALAKEQHVLPVAIVLNLPERVCHLRNEARPDRNFGPHVVRNQLSQLRRSLRDLRREGFRYVFVLNSPEEVEAASVERIPLWTDKRHETGPFDLIGDIHGCADELETLLAQLGYSRKSGAPPYRHPQGRRAIFLGDLVDRGPRVLDTLRIVQAMVAAGTALCIPGNHDAKLLRKLQGKQVHITHGLAETLAELDALSEAERGAFCQKLMAFLDSLVSHYVLDVGKLVVAHAGLKEEYQGRSSARVRDFALYGDTTGETDEFGLPVRLNWAADYRGNAMVVYGHTPVAEPEWLNRTINIDTGCVFGGKLTALRYPELELVSVPAAKTYCESARPFLPQPSAPGFTAQQAQDEVLDAADVVGKRIVSTRLVPNITIRAENAAAALEVMSRFAANPKWLIYLPPTMSPCETSQAEGLLEHPAEAFAYFRSQGIPQAICEEKHMGSRAVVVICRDAEAARQRFGIATGEAGIVYTRTGRSFFSDANLETAFLDRLRAAMTAANFWEQHQTTWACLDCELLPWSAKAQELLQKQYAAVGAAGRSALPVAAGLLSRTVERLAGDERAATEQNLAATRRRETDLERFVAAYRRYCWPVTSLDDLRLAPFHLLATEGHVHAQRDHVWHMEQLANVCQPDPRFLLATPYRVINLLDPAEELEGVQWWQELTERGGEGMVVKPLAFIARGQQGLVQPAIKCRGREYLRIIYGPGVHRAGASVPLAAAGAGLQAVARAAGIRPGHGVARPLRALRTASPRSRMRLRRAGARKRAGRSTTVSP
jgi:protein phosphatase